ncbi:flagella biosynthesis regulatory protein FliT [Enterobacteriaceae bacterium ESL0689]|nr:flagella biosynthesis regulatory protein FliT [Enterobacteriaceae bacterium ESL0689]
MDNPQLFTAWQQVHVFSQQILNFAQAGEWEKLIELELAYITAVENTTNSASEALAESAEQELLNTMLQQILANESEIRRLMQQRMDELKTLITQSIRQQAVNHTYSELSGSMLLPGEPQVR